MEIMYSSTPAVTAGKELSSMLAHHKDRATLLLLSGGSALTILDHISDAALTKNLTVTTLDERFSTDPKSNNFSQIKATEFFKRAQSRYVSFIDTTVTAEDTLVHFSERFEAALRGWRTKHPDGVVLVTMGVGTDGHTAGIFPNHLNAEVAVWVVSVTLPVELNPYPERITVTPLFLLEEVTQAFGFLTGEEKRDLLQRLQSSDCSHKEIPACIMKDMQSVTVITDLEAV